MESKDYLNKILELMKANPIIFITIVFNIIYGLISAIVSAINLSLFIGLTGLYNIIFGIAKIYGLARYHKIKKISDRNEVEKLEKSAAINISIYAGVMSFLHFSLAVVCVFFFEESPSSYHLWFIYFIAIETFIKIFIATANSIKTRKNHNIIIYYLKLMNFANALISLALLQRAILYFVDYKYARMVGGIGGIFFSLCAMIVCFRMYIKFYKKKEKKLGNSY